MAETTKRHISSDKTMAKWPAFIDPTADLITPYPCQTCKHEFRSCKALATHKCNPGGAKPPRVRRDMSPREKGMSLVEALADHQKKEHDLVLEIVDEMREARNG